MNVPHKESLPFADTDDEEVIERLRIMVETQLNLSYKAKEMNEMTYRRLSHEVCEINGDPFDHFTRIMREVQEAAEIALLDRLVIGEEFIESITPEDPRYTVAVTKFERLHEQFRRMKEGNESA